MKNSLFLITILSFLMVQFSCRNTDKNNSPSKKDSINYELKKKEIELKEKELKLKEEEIKNEQKKEQTKIQENKIRDVNPSEFEGTYRVGSTKCSIWEIRMVYEIKWVKGKGTNVIFFDYKKGDKLVYNETDPANDIYYGRFEFYKDHARGIYIRKDGKEFDVEKISR